MSKPKVNQPFETKAYAGGPPDGLQCKQLELPNTEEHLNLLNKEVELNEKSGRPYTTHALHSQLYPVDIKELRRQALEGGEDE